VRRRKIIRKKKKKSLSRAARAARSLTFHPEPSEAVKFPPAKYCPGSATVPLAVQVKARKPVTFSVVNSAAPGGGSTEPATSASGQFAREAS
jgi:hypothetical protein